MASGDETFNGPPKGIGSDATSTQPRGTCYFSLLPIELKDIIFKNILIDLDLFLNIHISHRHWPVDLPANPSTPSHLYVRSLLRDPMHPWWKGNADYSKMMRSCVRNQCFFKRREAPGLVIQLRRFIDLCLVSRDMYYGLTGAFLGVAWLNIELPFLWKATDGFMTDRVPNLSRPLLDNISFGSRIRHVCLRFDNDNVNTLVTPRSRPRAFVLTPDWRWQDLEATMSRMFAAMPNIYFFELYVNSDAIFQRLKKHGFFDHLRLLLEARKHTLRDVFIRGGLCEDVVHELHACLSSPDTDVRVRGLEWTMNPCWKSYQCGSISHADKSQLRNIIGGKKGA